MYWSVSIRKAEPKKTFIKTATKVNDDALQLGGALSWKINHDMSQWPKLVTGLGVYCQLCRWDSGDNFI